MTLVKHEDRLEITSEGDVVAARHKGRTLAAQIGFERPERSMITAAISELARNILDYARSGELLLRHAEDGDRHGIIVIASDRGPGIPNVQHVMQAGYAVSSLGLRGVRVLMDSVDVASVAGLGTTVTAWKWRS